MTVAELIEELKSLPPDIEVVTRAMDTYSVHEKFYDCEVDIVMVEKRENDREVVVLR